MSSQTLSDFLDGSGSKPYRKLVEQHLRASSEKDILADLQAQLELLPQSALNHIMGFLDLTRTKLGSDRSFWSTATCRNAADLIAGAVGEALPRENFMESFASTMRDGKTDLPLVFFRAATLNFAHMASCQPEWRKVMGVRKGLFR
jgi:hypothetical protein